MKNATSTPMRLATIYRCNVTAIVLLAVSIACSRANAATLVYEPFGGGANATQLDTSSATGVGFGSNTWTDLSGTATAHINRTGWSPQFPLNSLHTASNNLMAEMTPDGYAATQSSRNLSGVAIDFSADATYYMSFTSRVFNNDTWMSVSLHNSTTGDLGIAAGHRWGGNAGTGNPYQLTGAIAFGDNPLFGTGNWLGGDAGSAHGSGENLFYVMKIVATSAGTDQAFLKVYENGVDTIHKNPDVLSGEGSGVNNWNLISTGASSNLILDQLRIAHSGNGFPQVDEIRITTSWLEATGLPTAPEPSTMVLAMLGLLGPFGFGRFRNRLS